MSLGNDHIKIELASELILLRPTLRCGLRLERREGSFAKLISDLQEGSLTAARFVLADAFNRPTASHCIMDAGLDAVCANLIPFVLNCAGLDPDMQSTASDKPSRSSPSVTFGDHLTNLYRIATGWLGWTPEVALDATPTEIMEAYKGRVDMLKAIFGGDDDKAKSNADDLRQAFRDLGAKQVQREAA